MHYFKSAFPPLPSHHSSPPPQQKQRGQEQQHLQHPHHVASHAQGQDDARVKHTCVQPSENGHRVETWGEGDGKRKKVQCMTAERGDGQMDVHEESGDKQQQKQEGERRECGGMEEDGGNDDLADRRRRMRRRRRSSSMQMHQSPSQTRSYARSYAEYLYDTEMGTMHGGHRGNGRGGSTHRHYPSLSHNLRRHYPSHQQHMVFLLHHLTPFDFEPLPLPMPYFYSSPMEVNQHLQQRKKDLEMSRPQSAISFSSHLRGKTETIHNDFLNVDTNLYRFLKHTTPRFPCHNSTKRKAENCGKDTEQPFFELKDVWQFYDEPYGIEVPVMLSYHNVEKTFTYAVDEFVYFVPHLSAIQLFLEGGEDEPFFEFFESSRPHMRYPLIDKIEELASEQCPELVTLRSSELSQQSWFSIAWYPILCHNTTINWLKGQFITYHTMQPQHFLIDEQYCPFLESEIGPIVQKLHALQTWPVRGDDREALEERLSRVQFLESRMKAIQDHEDSAKEKIWSDLCQVKEVDEKRNQFYFAPVFGFVPYKVQNDMWFRVSTSSPPISGSKRSKSGSQRYNGESPSASPHSRHHSVPSDDLSRTSTRPTQGEARLESPDTASSPGPTTPPRLSTGKSDMYVSPTPPTAPHFVPSSSGEEEHVLARSRSHSDGSLFLPRRKNAVEFRAPLHLIRACNIFLNQRQLRHPDFDHFRERCDTLN